VRSGGAGGGNGLAIAGAGAGLAGVGFAVEGLAVDGLAPGFCVAGCARGAAGFAVWARTSVGTTQITANRIADLRRDSSLYGERIRNSL
jgi:hypothetical protein